MPTRPTTPAPTSPADERARLVLDGLDAWRALPAAQQPSWDDHAAVERAVSTLQGQPAAGVRR